ncbi:penicillin-binding protein [Nocardioides guangzhouensis]|uniref:Penicillin-binding protein n=1 Tax=Nocardioides guangzhouensis TaxID=2497878 RepID=A0A4Q4ZI74_9ACTN|nr:penicillin-binding transpeptidase domain-containing protein [Nocardioides guangzhouensis]RYP87578.1 penicillin-binding protein [Nocardioides guangzhouensis]
MRRLGIRVPVTTAAIVLQLGTLTACTDDGARQDAAEEYAADLAAALTKGDLGDLTVSGGGQEDLDRTLGDLGEYDVEVSAGDVEVADDAGTAMLHWAWQTPAGPWEYDAEATLEPDGDDWLVTWVPSLVEPSLASGERLESTTLRARRGDILGAGDEPLVTARPVVRFGIDKTKVKAAQAPVSARALAGLLDVDPTPYAKLVKAAGPQAFVEALVLRESDAGSVRGAGLDAIPGAVGIGGEMPLAPTREFAAPILGRVGPATAEIVEKSDGAVRPGDEVGLSGLQARYDDELGGTPGIRIQAVGGKEERVLFTADETNGEPLRTTLDPGLQTDAEAALAGIGPASAVVAIRPSTGDVLAAASGPGSDGYNTATFGQYAPGSTMKVVTSLALLRAGLQPSTTVPCTPSIVVDGKRFENYDDYPSSALGDIALRTAVANSCNTAFISQHGKLGERDLTQAAAALGLGVDHDLGFPAYFGSVPKAASETEKAASLIGQGKVLASPMAMATVAASVVQGKTVLPRLLPDHDASREQPAEPLTGGEAQVLRELMRAVVTDGSGAFLADVPGPPIGAKTGTAEFGTGDPLPTHVWMIAIRGDLAVAVFVDRGQSGSQTAGPILEEFLRSAG